MSFSTTSLTCLLSNHIILGEIALHLSYPCRLALSSTCKDLKSLILGTPEVWRRFEAFPLVMPPNYSSHWWRFIYTPRSISFKAHVFRHVRVLILDRQPVEIFILEHLLLQSDYRIRILSMIGQRFNEGFASDLHDLIESVVSKARKSPSSVSLKGIYYFGTSCGPVGLLKEPCGERPEAGKSEKTTQRPAVWHDASIREVDPSVVESSLVVMSRGVIAWDALLCRGYHSELEHTKYQQDCVPCMNPPARWNGIQVTSRGTCYLT